MLSRNQALYIPSGDVEKGSFSTLLYPGQLGQCIEVNQGTPTAPLWVTYRLVKLKAGITLTLGEVLWWDDRDDYVVTNVETDGAIAGVTPAGSTAVVPTAGEYFFMVTRGRRKVRYQDSPTVTPDALGKIVVATATNGRADCVTATANLDALIIGRSAGAVDGTATDLGLVDINIFDQA